LKHRWQPTRRRKIHDRLPMFVIDEIRKDEESIRVFLTDLEQD
jgi:hypothetical protein